MAKHTDTEIAEARAALLEHVHTGATVYAVLRTRSKSGMSRTVSFYVHDGARMVWLDGWLAVLLGMRRVYGAHDALRVNGVGFDAAHHVVSHLSEKLFGKSDQLTREWL